MGDPSGIHLRVGHQLETLSCHLFYGDLVRFESQIWLVRLGRLEIWLGRFDELAHDQWGFMVDVGWT